MMDAFEWAGFNTPQTRWIAGGSGFVYLTAIEMMDGFSRGWGFSWGDQVANTLGAALVISQKIAWNEQKVLLKFSYAPSGLARYNPSLLGNTASTKLLKDYNAQTYWLSLNPFNFCNRKTKFSWLNLALGYGAYGMIGGHKNSFVVEDNGNVLKFERQRHVYLGLDVDFTRIKTRSKILKTVFTILNVVKVPSPCIDLSAKGLAFRFL